jgi:2-desacetyl-2-hydroxyethyl bacteriochlorophyllide A dehydrogenase
MRAAVVTAPGRCQVEDWPDPIPGPGEVVVEVNYCGVCGTDIHVVDGEHAAVTYPVVPGHEFAGHIVAAGTGPTPRGPGEFVAVDPMVFCGHCPECRAGWTNLCRNGGGLGTTADGAFARYVKVQAAQCEPVPAAVPPRWAALAEPLACCLHALDRIGAVIGRQVLVLGAGTAGLMLVRLLSLGGAAVDVAEPRPERRAAAGAFGAQRVAVSAAALGAGEGWHVVVDATGNPAAIAEGLSLVRRAGTFAIFGVPPAAARVPLVPYDVFARELTIVGSNSVRHTFGRALALLATGAVPGDALLGPVVPLEDMADALASARSGDGMKTTVAPGAPSSTRGRRAPGPVPPGGTPRAVGGGGQR